MADYNVDIALRVKGQKQVKDLLKPINEINKNVKELVKITKQSAKTIPAAIEKVNKKFDKTDKKLKKIKKQAKESRKELERLNKVESGGFGGFPQKSRRSRIIQSAAIGGGFPLLFGGGLGQAIPGLIGGGVGEALTPGGGFAGSIAATAVIAELTKIGQASIETAGKLSTLNGKLELARERSLFTSNETEELARQLERQGKAQELNNLLNEEYQKIIGAEGVAKLNKLNEVSSEFGRLMGMLKTSFDAFIAGPLTRFLKLLNNILGQDVNRRQFDRFRFSLKGQEKEDFEARLKELRGTRGRTGGPITDAIRKTMMKEFGVQLLSEPKGKSLTPQAQLAKDRMADLDKEIEKATKKNEMSEKQFEIEMRIQEIKKGTLGLDDDEIKKKLEKLYKLDQEQEKVKKLNDLYKDIGNSIETGLVSAIEGAINGTKTLGDVARSVFGQIQRSLISFGVNALLGGLFPGSRFFGGTRAEGGPVKGGKSYLVGERGPEMFSPGVSGTITPNHAMGGTTNIVVNVDASGSSVEGDEEQGRELGRLISVAIQSELIEQRRPGGLLR